MQRHAIVPVREQGNRRTIHNHSNQSGSDLLMPCALEETADPTRGETTPRIAFGPRLPGIGSWDWVGADLAAELSGPLQILTFDHDILQCDLVVIVKYHHRQIIPAIPADVPILFLPIDSYGSAAEIDADWRLLRRCARIIVHAEPLRKYFQSYAPVEYLDHHIKYAAPLRETFQDSGPILWVGMQSNLRPVVEWVNHHGLPEELIVLTNLEEGVPPPEPAELGFQAGRQVRIERWTATRQRELTTSARAALDIKGNDFRQRHKPPAKAIDFIASGLPLAMNADSSSTRHMQRLGLQLVAPEDTARWLSRNYWEEVEACGRQLRIDLSRAQVARRLGQIIRDVLNDHSKTPELPNKKRH